MEIIGADGVHVGTVDKVEGNRIKLMKKDSVRALTRAITCIDWGPAAGVERNKVRLSATSAVAAAMEEEQTLIVTAGVTRWFQIIVPTHLSGTYFRVARPAQT
jgi:hypothetical protein